MFFKIKSLIKASKKSLISFLIVFVGFMILGLFVFSKDQPTSIKIKEKVWPVETLELVSRNLAPSVKAFGQVISSKEITLRSLVGGRLNRVSDLFENGVEVEKGTFLLELEPFDFKQKVIEAEADIMDLEGKLKASMVLKSEARLQKNFALNEVVRREKLSRDIISQKALEESKSNLSKLVAAEAREYQNATTIKANLEKAQSNLKRAKKDLDDTIIEAPFSGVLSDTFIEEGSEIRPHEKIATITDIRNLEIRFFIGEKVFSSLIETKKGGIGHNVLIFWETSDKVYEYSGKITRIDGLIDKKAAGINVYAKIVNLKENDSLRPGAFIEVEFEISSKSKVFLLPEKAIHNEGIVYIVENDRLIERSVEVVGFSKGKILVTGDIYDGESLVITPITRIGPGLRVEVINNGE